jgi:sialic acid synthase SpsE
MCKQYSNNIVVIGETAFNHEGDFSYFLRLIDSVAESGATHVKFQVLIDYNEFVSELSETYPLVTGWVFTQEEWVKIFDYAESKDLLIFAMPLDLKSVELCLRDSVEFVEVHSVSFYDELLLEKIKSQLVNKIVAFGVGGRTLEELKAVESYFSDKKLLFMCGYQAYPSELEEVKISRLKYFKKDFPDVILGYADHSAPDTNDAIYSSMYAYSLGARVFEKHVTLDSPRIDSQSAFSGQQLTDFVYEMNRYLGLIEESRSASFKMTESEKVYRNRQKKVVAIKDIDVGDIFTSENISLKMHSLPGGCHILKKKFNNQSANKYKSGELILE